ncbi:hypothetical protein CJF32_00006020 [Rutstroemia sp. NJR-2017a WRK4]|nr:hypothetical protein CJF32_00006020 [Rutstroemia sp. NJR-2017a WRK4]
MSINPMDTSAQLSIQWKNPSDILSLLLIIGGDVVERAIAQLFGYYIQPSPNWPRLYLTPVAFSFGWVGYAFTSLASVVGDKQLMPSEPDCPSVVINCSTGYARINRSWILGRLLRDHELAMEGNQGHDYEDLPNTGKHISLRIDIFDIEEAGKPEIDKVWIFGWLTIITQLGISIAPWIQYSNCGVFLITVSGTLLALITGSLRQWGAEKWAGRLLNEPGSTKNKSKTVCLTRGNGHRHAMILRGRGTALDLEKLATATSESLSETPWLLGSMALLWAFLLITVSGLKQNTWFLILIGAIGMVQNIYASAARRSFGTLNLRLTKYQPRPSIVGLGFDWPNDDPNSDEDMNINIQQWRQPLHYRETPGVRGAIRELEKLFPKAGASLMSEFFPALIKYEPERYRTNSEKKFWKKAFRELSKPTPEDNHTPRGFISVEGRAFYFAIPSILGFDCDEKAIRTAFKKEGFIRAVARRKLALSETNIKDRLQWAQEHINWTNEQWDSVCWTD